MTTCFPRGLYGITPEWDDTARLLAAIEAAAAGGMAALQWRRKQIPDELKREQAAHVVALCRRLGVISIINDDPLLALQVGADGVHLGRDDGDVAQARRQLGEQLLIGASCYNELSRAERALQEGADYVAFGAMFASSVKPHAVKASTETVNAGRNLVHSFQRAGKRPAVVTIGGITPDNAPQVIQAGADSIAVITALFTGSAEQIKTAAQRYSELFTART